MIKIVIYLTKYPVWKIEWIYSEISQLCVINYT